MTQLEARAAPDSAGPICQIELMSGAQDGQIFDRLACPITIGRHASSTLELVSEPSLCRHHAQIVHEDGAFWIEPITSDAVVWVGDCQIFCKTELSDGALFRLGRIEFELSLMGRTRDKCSTMDGLEPSPDTQAVLAIAAEQARAMEHPYLGTEHMFIGLCKCDDQLVQAVFATAGVDPVATRRYLRTRLEVGEPAASKTQPHPTPRSKDVLGLAIETAQRDKASAIKPIHLLSALVSEGRGVPIRALRRLGGNLDTLARRIHQGLGSPESLPKVPLSGRTPTLDKFGRDLTALARQGKLPTLIGRRAELRRLAQILARKQKNNVCLIGEPGVGKTCIVEGLALKAISQDSTPEIRDRRIVELSMSALVAGSAYRGEFEERLQKIIKEAGADAQIIIFIDEIHTMIGAGSAGGQAMDAAQILKPALARGEVRCIGATTAEEYQKYIESDPALARRFQPLRVEEPSASETIEILLQIRSSYELHHRAEIDDQAIRSAVELSVRYLPDRRLPDKAIDLIDEAASRLRLRSLTITPEQLEVMRRDPDATPIVRVRAEDVARVVSQWTGIPVDSLSPEQAAQLEQLEDQLRRRVIGQDHAVRIVSDVVRTARAGLADPRRPNGVFLFLGPTGVGKTELARALAEALFGDESRMIRFDMSEFTEEHSLAKLIGSPPGYKGSDEGGKLTNAVRAQPYSVVLLDEIEKANPRLFSLFLQVFDEGCLTDAQGKRADFTNTIIIMTSNLGACRSVPAFGFHGAHSMEERDRQETAEVMTDLKAHFAPEFLNRIDEYILFRPLTHKHTRAVLGKYLTGLEAQLMRKQVELSIDDDVYDLLLARGYSTDFGARNLRRIVEKDLVRPLARKLLAGDLPAKSVLRVRVQEERIVADVIKDMGDENEENGTGN